MVTHDAHAAAIADRVLFLADGDIGRDLGQSSAREILALLRDSVDTLGQTTVMVTHDAHAAAIADRILFLADGDIVSDLGPSTAHDILATLEHVSAR
jgi:putative ABC transport system ATP-binding protein